jgi:hypothetical protein
MQLLIIHERHLLMLLLLFLQQTPTAGAAAATTAAATTAAAAAAAAFLHLSSLQVIKCELFDEAVDRAIKRYPLMLLTAPTQAATGYR